MEIGWVNTPEDWRDVFIMAYMVAGTLLFLFAILFTLIVGFVTTRTALMAHGILKNNLQPTIENVRETSENVRGTVAFISDYAVTPVVRAYSTYAGARRFILVFMRFARPKQRAG